MYFMRAPPPMIAELGRPGRSRACCPWVMPVLRSIRPIVVPLTLIHHWHIRPSHTHRQQLFPPFNQPPISDLRQRKSLEILGSNAFWKQIFSTNAWNVVEVPCEFLRVVPACEIVRKKCQLQLREREGLQGVLRPSPTETSVCVPKEESVRMARWAVFAVRCKSSVILLKSTEVSLFLLIHWGGWGGVDEMVTLVLTVTVRGGACLHRVRDKPRNIRKLLICCSHLLMEGWKVSKSVF